MTPTVQTPVSKIRNRQTALRMLLPKMFGILWEKGQKMGDLPVPGYSVQFDEDRQLMATLMGPHLMLVDIYWPLNSVTKKVFSARVTDLPAADEPSSPRDWTYHVGVVSWRRGEWEEAIHADAVSARSLSELYLLVEKTM